MKKHTAYRLVIAICMVGIAGSLFVLMGGCASKPNQDLIARDNARAEQFWCERSNGTYTNEVCSLGDNY